MKSFLSFLTKDVYLSISVFILLILSLIVLNSIAPSLFPSYFINIVIAILAFWFFAQIGFDIVALFSKHFYMVSIFLLLLTLVIGNVTRGTIRWIPIGPLNIQPGEIVRPFLLVFFAVYLTREKVTLKRTFKVLLLLALPAVLILVQPSLGVSIITVIGFIGVAISTNFNKKYLFVVFAVLIAVTPLFWQIMTSYQKQRILNFLEPESAPLGAGYNSLQSTIAAGAGEITGRGLGRGIQTQLSFLPAKQTDFIFSATAEELGIIGAGLMLAATFVILWRLTAFMGHSVSPAARAYLSGFFLTYLAQVFIHTGMDMGLLPVTGLPFPLVSAGGSSLLATMIGLGIALGAYRR